MTVKMSGLNENIFLFVISQYMNVVITLVCRQKMLTESRPALSNPAFWYTE
jgi:hypothetical protein